MLKKFSDLLGTLFLLYKDILEYVLLSSHMKYGRDNMRVFIISVCILIIAYVIKVDLHEGGLNYTSIKETKSCDETFIIEKVRVQIQSGDSLYSIFAVIPTKEELSIIERTDMFYQLNPHLKQQSFIPGEFVYVPIAKKKKMNC